MAEGAWMGLLVRQSRAGVAIGWDEMVVGYDFDLLKPGEIQGWARIQDRQGPRVRELAALAGEQLLGFEPALWAACAEGTGKVPRPGDKRWARAQDHWRVALLRDALESPLSPQALAIAVESIYERVGCPEDMLDLWQRHSPWQQRPGMAERTAVAGFLRRCEAGLLTQV